jgi:hypothetical protein
MCVSQKEAEKKFIKDGFCALGLCLCNFFEQSFGGFVRWHADLFLLSHFCSCSFKAMLPQALPLTDWKEMAYKKPVACHTISKKRRLSFGTAATQKNICVGSCVWAIFFCGACGVGYLT